MKSEYKTKELFLNKATNFMLTKIGFHRPFGFEKLSEFDFDKYSNLLDKNGANTIDAIRKITGSSRIGLLEDYLIDKGFIIPHYENEQFNGTPSLFRLTSDGKELLRIGSIEKYYKYKTETIEKLTIDLSNARLINKKYIQMYYISLVSVFLVGITCFMTSYKINNDIKFRNNNALLNIDTTFKK